MIDIDDVIKEVSKRTGIDIDTVSTVCKHPFICTMQIMKDDEDTHDILFHKLFKFKLKPRFKNDKQIDYSPKNKDYENN